MYSQRTAARSCIHNICIVIMVVDLIIKLCMHTTWSIYRALMCCVLVHPPDGGLTGRVDHVPPQRTAPHRTAPHAMWSLYFSATAPSSISQHDCMMPPSSKKRTTADACPSLTAVSIRTTRRRLHVDTSEELNPARRPTGPVTRVDRSAAADIVADAIKRRCVRHLGVVTRLDDVEVRCTTL